MTIFTETCFGAQKYVLVKCGNTAKKYHTNNKKEMDIAMEMVDIFGLDCFTFFGVFHPPIKRKYKILGTTGHSGLKEATDLLFFSHIVDCNPAPAVLFVDK